MATRVYTGTLSVNESAPSEQTLKEITVTKRTAIRSIWVCVVNLTVNVTVKLYKKDNSGTYRVLQGFAGAFSSGDIMFELFSATGMFYVPIETYTDFKITMQSAGGGGGSVDVTYEIDYDDTLDEVADAIVAMAAKLPTNHMMGSSVKDDIDTVVSRPGTAQTITAPADMALNSTVAKEATLTTKIPTALSFTGANVNAESKVTAAPTDMALNSTVAKEGTLTTLIPSALTVSGGRVDANLKAVEGQLTNGYNATLKLKAIKTVEPLG